ncbi:MAG: hypothetical protein K6G38_04430 [Gammaproteobacteria bacterium]|nr:hypothetical protein [Gammaproteobacteria bacterium]
MKILLVNDDGIKSKNLYETKRALALYGDVYISAPSAERSGASVSLSVYKGLNYHVIDDMTISVDGSPADCVFVGIEHFKNIKFDLIVSGTNIGLNESYDHLFSGTIGGAISAGLFSSKSLALSANFDEENVYLKTKEAIEYTFKNNLLDVAPMISINYPDNKFEKGLGFRVGRIDILPNCELFIHKGDYVKTYRNAFNPIEGTDRYYTQNGYYSITPLKPNFMDESLLDSLKEIIEK